MLSLFKSSTAAPARNPLTLGLRISLPQKVTLESILQNIADKAEQINFSSLMLSHHDIDRIKEAFSKIPPNSKITLFVSQVFVNPKSESAEDLITFWNAVKYKVQKVVWDQNKFHQRFLSFLKEDIAKDASITAKLEFSNCDNTDSAKSQASQGNTPNSDSSGARGSMHQGLVAYSMFPSLPKDVARGRQVSCPHFQASGPNA